MTTDQQQALDEANAGIREIGEHLEAFFQGDRGKIGMWLQLPNPMLGNLAPVYLLRNHAPKAELLS